MHTNSCTKCTKTSDLVLYKVSKFARAVQTYGECKQWRVDYMKWTYSFFIYIKACMYECRILVIFNTITYHSFWKKNTTKRHRNSGFNCNNRIGFNGNCNDVCGFCSPVYTRFFLRSILLEMQIGWRVTGFLLDGNIKPNVHLVERGSGLKG